MLSKKSLPLILLISVLSSPNVFSTDDNDDSSQDEYSYSDDNEVAGDGTISHRIRNFGSNVWKRISSSLLSVPVEEHVQADELNSEKNIGMASQLPNKSDDNSILNQSTQEAPPSDMHLLNQTHNQKNILSASNIGEESANKKGGVVERTELKDILKNNSSENKGLQSAAPNETDLSSVDDVIQEVVPRPSRKKESFTLGNPWIRKVSTGTEKGKKIKLVFKERELSPKNSPVSKKPGKKKKSLTGRLSNKKKRSNDKNSKLLKKPMKKKKKKSDSNMNKILIPKIRRRISTKSKNSGISKKSVKKKVRFKVKDKILPPIQGIQKDSTKGDEHDFNVLEEPVQKEWKVAKVGLGSAIFLIGIGIVGGLHQILSKKFTRKARKKKKRD